MVSVNLCDGVCRDCGGHLLVIGADDCTMEVECEICGDAYTVEPDAFGDGGIEYWPAMLAEQAGGQ